MGGGGDRDQAQALAPRGGGRTAPSGGTGTLSGFALSLAAPAGPLARPHGTDAENQSGVQGRCPADCREGGPE